jgi:hypothetical protein
MSMGFTFLSFSSMESDGINWLFTYIMIGYIKNDERPPHFPALPLTAHFSSLPNAPLFSQHNSQSLYIPHFYSACNEID